jgi:hypothetical protein
VKTLILTVALVLGSLLIGCRSKTTSSSVDFFPGSNAVQGWVKSSDTRTFAASHLWEYIDGDADRYVRAGVVKTLTSDYRFNGKIDATADVHVMANPGGAKRVYESESGVGSTPLAVGDAARIAKGSLTFRQGSYLVRIVAYEDSPEMTQALTELARAICTRLSPQSPISGPR